MWHLAVTEPNRRIIEVVLVFALLFLGFVWHRAAVSLHVELGPATQCDTAGAVFAVSVAVAIVVVGVVVVVVSTVVVAVVVVVVVAMMVVFEKTGRGDFGGCDDWCSRNNLCV